MSNQLALKAISRILNIFTSSEAQIRQYFINGGLNEKEARKVTFQKTMTLH